jgi:DNA-binding MarR family transcriptional regulator
MNDRKVPPATSAKISLYPSVFTRIPFDPGYGPPGDAKDYSKTAVTFNKTSREVERVAEVVHKRQPFKPQTDFYNASTALAPVRLGNGFRGRELVEVGLRPVYRKFTSPGLFRRAVSHVVSVVNRGKPRTGDRRGSVTGMLLVPFVYIVIRLNRRWRNLLAMGRSLTTADYQALAELRHQIRKFLHFSEQAARRAGLEPRQHQLMLGLKGLPHGVRPSIGELAQRLLIEHHSTVELVNRLAKGGYVQRDRAGEDRRAVLVSLTRKGEKILRELSLDHRAELRVQGPALTAALRRTMSKNRQGSSSKLARRPEEKNSRSWKMLRAS